MTFKANSDARVQSSIPNANFGSTKTIWAGNGSVSYLVFNVKGLPGLRGAKLRLWVTDPSQNNVQVAFATPCFGESDVTSTTAPATSILGFNGNTNYVFKPSQANAWVEVGVGGVFGDGIVTFALTRGGADMAKFSSREGDHPPELAFDGVPDATPPTTQLTQPPASSTVAGITTIVASADDNADLQKVDFFRDGTLVGAGSKSAEGYVLDWDTRGVANGAYTLKARATDTSGNMTTSKYQITVSNALPPTPPVASFSTDTPGGVAPVSVAVADTSVGSPERWSWSFGDGASSRLRVPPAHLYAKPGTYTITLAVTNITASTSTSQTVSVTAFDRPNRLPGSTRILLMGDSITFGYCQNAAQSLLSRGYSVSVIADNGIGLLSAVPDEVQKLQSFVSGFDPDEILVEELGNYAQSTNSIDPSVQPESPEFFALWNQRAAQISSIGLSRGALFWWLDNPPTSTSTPQGRVSGALTTLYHGLYAGHPGLQYVDAYYPFGGPVLDESLRTSGGVHLNAAGAVLMSNLVVNAVATRASDNAAPSAPVLNASLNGFDRPSLSWSRSVDSGRSGLVGYKIFRDGDPTPYADSVDPAALTFVDSNVTTNTSYSYVLAGYDAAGNQTESNVVSVFVADNLAPSVPTLTGALNPDNSVGLSWTASTDQGSGLAGYRLYRDDQSTPYATIPPDATTYTDAGASPGTTYAYTVTAFDGVGNESEPSNSVSVSVSVS